MAALRREHLFAYSSVQPVKGFMRMRWVGNFVYRGTIEALIEAWIAVLIFGFEKYVFTFSIAT